MNHIRSTERSLTLLRFKGIKKCMAKSNLRAIHVSCIDKVQSIQKYNKRSMAWLLRGPKIKYLDVSKTTRSERCLSTTVDPKLPLNLSLLNPNKPAPNKDLVLEPIQRPLTWPKFPSNHSTKDLPSVTKVLQTTMPAKSAFMLEMWRKAMIEKLGIEGFKKYQNDTFERGRILHELVANYLLGSGEPVQGKGELSKEIVSNLWKSIEKVVKEKITNVRLIEHIVSHKDMNYRGIVDCVACFNDELAVIDFKTSEKPKKSLESLYDNPLQVSAYCGAINNDPNIPLNVIDRNICAGVVIVAYIDGSEASIYHLGPKDLIEAHWKKWTVRLDQYFRLEEAGKPKKINRKS